MTPRQGPVAPSGPPNGLGDWQRGKRRGLAIVFVMAVLLLALLCAATVSVLSSARAYVGGESLYSKGQKNAVRFLGQYLRSGDEADYQRYVDALAVPLGDRLAQLELEKPAPDYAVVRRGFLQGGNDPADLDSLIGFYRLFRHVPLVSGAIDIWATADEELLEIKRLGEQIHAARGAGVDDGWRPAYEIEMNRLDDVLNAEEMKFSRQLGKAARWVQNLLLAGTFGLALALIVGGLLFARMMWTRLARSQQAVEEGNARWVLAADAGRFGVVEWRPDDTVVLDARAAAIYEMPAAPGGLYPARLLRLRVHPDDRQAMKAAILQAVDADVPMVQRHRVVLPSGAARHLEVDGRAFMAGGKGVSHMVGLVRDVTDEVNAQSALLEEGAAQRTYQAKREFLSRVSHELRTPLNAVIGFSDLLRTDPVEPLTATQRSRLDRVVDGGQYLLRLVNDLLDVARLEVGEMSIALSSVRLAPVLRNAADLLETARAARGIRVEMDEPPPQLFVIADPVRLKQVFVNILSNAIKYNRPDGTVFVGFSLTPTQAVVTVRDQGRGMSSQQQRDLFVPFRRLGEEPNATEGAGLGLVISRHLAERLGGSLDVASAPGAGTTVTIRLKRDAEDFPETTGFEATTSFASALPGAAGVIVYIEDDPVNVILMEQYVSMCADVQLLVARDGQAGLDLARAWMPNLILLDMQLPDMSGLDVLDRLRADPATSGIRVVALSADAMPAQVTEAIARGAEAYWTKPLSLSKFKSELPKFLR
ncbi:MAG: hybrid sensor histidine kinase/response regulator [Betaproteobacteria bacterium]